MKRVLYFFNVFIFSFLLNSFIVNANTIKNIEMDIFIDQYGTAIINETWDAFLDEGTEGYKNFSDMSNSYITDFSVIDDSGTSYGYMNNWNSSWTFYLKQYKYGIINNGSSVDLCWGISNYGERTYNLSYKINNFVNNYRDKQGIYFKLIKLDQNVNNVNIKINSYIPLNIDNSKIWGFGYNGKINFQDNGIVMNVGKLKDSEYVTLMVRFEEHIYNTNSNINKSFDDIYEEAFEISKSEQNKKREKALNLLYLILIVILPFGFCIGLVFLFAKIFSLQSYKFEDGKNIGNINNVNYYRDIPCDKDLFVIYFLVKTYFNNNDEQVKKKLISALFIKWILQKKIEFKNNVLIVKYNESVESLFPNNERTNFIDSQQIEETLFNFIIIASGQDKILEKDKFQEWCYYSYKHLISWYESVDEYLSIILRSKNFISDEVKVKKHFIYTTYKSNPIYTLKMKEEVVKLLGLKKFLLDFGRLYEKNTIDVVLWNYYLICAELFDIADKVKKELKGFYPEFNIPDELDNIIDEYVSKGYNSMKKADHDANVRNNISKNYDYSGRSSSSGGGGSSFSSGGSSSGGSSGGGFR